MSNGECPDCGGTSFDQDPDTAATFCTDCGRLISESTLRSDNIDLTSTKNIVTPYGGGNKVRLGSVVNSNQSVRILDSYQDLVKERIYGYVYRILQRLHIPTTYANQIKHLLSRVFAARSNSRWVSGRQGELLAAGCTYIICRQQNKAVTLLDIADAVQCSVFKLGAIYVKQVSLLKIRASLPDIDPALFIDRALSEIMKQNNATAKALEDETPVSDEAPEDLFDEGFYYNEDEEKKKKEQTNSTNNSNIDIADISRKTLRLVNEAQRDWLTTGRRPVAVTAAALMICLEACKKKSLCKLQTICNILHVSYSTAKKRKRELKALLLDIGRAKLPWGNDITEQNLQLHYGGILKYLDFMHSKAEESKKNSAANKLSINGNTTKLPAVNQGLQLPTVGTKRARDEETNAMAGLPIIVSSANKRAKIDPKPAEQPKNSNKAIISETSNDSRTSNNGNESKSLRDSIGNRALPPAFKASQVQREIREKKIDRAKKRLAYFMQHIKDEKDTNKIDPGSDAIIDLNADDINSITPINSNTSANTSSAPNVGFMEDEPPDEEEMLIARLLLEGADEHLIREGFYQNVHKPVDQEQLYNTELTDADLNDEEFKSMIRDDIEVAALSVFYAQQDKENEKDELSA
jgi:transcription initiation factor TFIIIB Brf1 subunit/transcription initiation factor TFIIB